MTHDQLTKTAIDTAVVGAGLSAPWWVAETTVWFGWVAALTAAIIGVLRLVAVVRELRNGKKVD